MGSEQRVGMFGRLIKKAATTLFRPQVTVNPGGYGRGLDPLNPSGVFQLLSQDQVRERNALALVKPLKRAKYKVEAAALDDVLSPVREGSVGNWISIYGALQDVAAAATRRADTPMLDAIIAITDPELASPEVGELLPYPNSEWGLEPLGCMPVVVDGVQGWVPYGQEDNRSDVLGSLLLLVSEESDGVRHLNAVFTRDAETVLWSRKLDSIAQDLPAYVDEAYGLYDKLEELESLHATIVADN
jgi:hypothetical protein